jgi:hypothetical protein
VSQDYFTAFQRQVQDQTLIINRLSTLTSRLRAIEVQLASASSVNDPSSSSHVSTSAAQDYSYGLPGYGNVPTVRVVAPSLSLALPLFATLALVPTTSHATPPSSTAALVSIAPIHPSVPLPIHRIPFPHSPSPIPGFPDPHHSAYPPQQHPHNPHHHNLPFPNFDGKEDPIGWLTRCESFYNKGTSEMDKVWLDVYHLTGVAQQWSFMLRHDEPTLQWSCFKTLCQRRFGPPLRSNTLGEVARLPFRFTVEDYQDRLMALLCHAEPVPPPHQQVQLFIIGLPGRLRMDVELRAPGDLQQAMALARAYERRA